MGISNTTAIPTEHDESCELRFEFGKNWAKFLAAMNEERIREAELSLKKTLRVEDLVGKSFLDIGSGSGLFSLAARRLGARVHSFDYDPNSVGCTQELRQRYRPGDVEWTIERGSALDEEYLRSLGQFDVVYSWGVLHHTGNMSEALKNAAVPVRCGGKLLISIYNDQGLMSRWWTRVKVAYNRLPRALRFVVIVPSFMILWGPTFIHDTIRLRPLHTWRADRGRGMSAWHDLVDWVGGYPFEVAKPEKIFEFFHERNFELEGLRTCAGGLGCNEFVFIRRSGNDISIK